MLLTLCSKISPANTLNNVSPTLHGRTTSRPALSASASSFILSTSMLLNSAAMIAISMRIEVTSDGIMCVSS